MKRLLLVLASILISTLLCVAAARAVTTYNSTLDGFQSATENEGIGLVLDAGGDLPGMSRMTLVRDGNNVTGGSWTLTILPANADAAANERGKLSGSVTGGSLSFTSEGTLSGASSIQLTVETGTGEYAAVTSGTGTINLSAAADNPSQLTGTLVLDF